MSAWMFGPLLAACSSLEGGPDRIYSPADEVAQARGLLEGADGTDGLVAKYEQARSDNERIYYRNEIIGRRMYVIDVEYSVYEAALTRERQKFGFASDVASQGLTTAGALFTPASTTKILAGLAGAVGATKGFYDSEIVIARTIQIAEAQMRAQRDIVAKRMLLRRNETAITYPLSAALSDLEDYYRAGTLNSGLIKASGDAGEAAQIAAANKELVVQYGSDASTKVLIACLKKPGAVDVLLALLSSHSRRELAALQYDTTPSGVSRRADLLKKAAGFCS